MLYYMSTQEGGKPMRISEASRMLDRSPTTIKRWIKSGYLKAVKIGRDWDVAEIEVQRHLNGKVQRRRKTLYKE